MEEIRSLQNGSPRSLEDHPRYRKWLGSPRFISHEVRPFGRGPTTRSLGDLDLLTMVINHLQVMG